MGNRDGALNERSNKAASKKIKPIPTKIFANKVPGDTSSAKVHLLNNCICHKAIILLVIFKHLPGKSDYKDFIKGLTVGPEALRKVVFASLTKRHRVTSNLIGILMNNIVLGIWFKSREGAHAPSNCSFFLNPKNSRGTVP